MKNIKKQSHIFPIRVWQMAIIFTTFGTWFAINLGYYLFYAALFIGILMLSLLIINKKHTFTRKIITIIAISISFLFGWYMTGWGLFVRHDGLHIFYLLYFIIFMGLPSLILSFYLYKSLFPEKGFFILLFLGLLAIFYLNSSCSGLFEEKPDLSSICAPAPLSQ